MAVIDDFEIAKPRCEDSMQILNNADNSDAKAHNLLNKIMSQYHEWNAEIDKPSDLIIQNVNEYIYILKLRELFKLHNDLLTKDMCDKIEMQKQSLFDKRNEGKIPNPPLRDDLVEQKKKRKFFKKKS